MDDGIMLDALNSTLPVVPQKDITPEEWEVLRESDKNNERVQKYLPTISEKRMRSVATEQSYGNTYNFSNAGNVIIGNGNQETSNSNDYSGATITYVSGNSALNGLRELTQAYMDEYKEDIHRLFEIVEKLENGTIPTKTGVFDSVKALITLIPPVGNFLKEKFPEAFA